MNILDVIKKNNPLETEQFIAESPSTSWLIRECINAGVEEKLLEQSKSFKALGMRHIIQSSLTGLNLLNRSHAKKVS